MRPSLVLAAAIAFAALPALAVERCELNGEHVNPNNGNTTAGKTGLMRCRDGDDGPVVREQELQNGVFMGVVRFFRDGQLERDYRVNARGNRDGIAREYAPAAEPNGKPHLVREETFRDGRTVGIARSWTPDGRLRRIAFHGDDDREQASAEFNAQGQLAELRCGKRPLLGPDADDAHWCGHAGAPSEVVLYNAKGIAKSRVSYERGEARKSELLGERGVVRDVHEASASGGSDRSFYADGTLRREVQWVAAAGGSGRVTTLERDFHESGKLVRERRFRVGERGARAEPASEQTWYLNGQPKERTELVAGEGATIRRETAYHDNGRKAFEGAWRVADDPRRGATPTGVHRSWDSDGHLRGERFHDERGRLTRERELAADGSVVRDDEVFEDGSRKAVGK